MRVAVVYLGFNLCLNLLLAATRPLDIGAIVELGHLDSRSEAAVLLVRHYLWHSSWEDEQTAGVLLEDAAAEHHVDVHLLRALVEVESGWRCHAVSPVGACGLTQLMPATARELGITDPFDPRENLQGGARYLARLLEQFDGETALALAGYNAGPAAVRRFNGVPPYPETRRYVSEITRRYRDLLSRQPR